MIDHSSHVGVQHFVNKLIRTGLDRVRGRGLVAGFGEGHEAEYLQRHTRSAIIGIDIQSRIPPEQEVSFYPILASAMDLPFIGGSFDFVFYHHVIEHVPDPAATLAEIHRLLVPGGLLYVGTPNRNRIIGYVGAYQISLGRKIRNNLLDYKNRLLGRFHNDLGAHAGFSKVELENLLTPKFRNLEWLTAEYLGYKYRERFPTLVLNFLLSPHILEYSAPSIYVLCRK